MEKKEGNEVTESIATVSILFGTLIALIGFALLLTSVNIEEQKKPEDSKENKEENK